MATDARRGRVRKRSATRSESTLGQPSRGRIEREVTSIVVRADEPVPSKGHLAWLDDGGKEAYEQGGEVYLAPSDRPLDITGYRQGGRWEASVSHWRRYFDTLFQPRVSRPPSRRRP